MSQDRYDILCDVSTSSIRAHPCSSRLDGVVDNYFLFFSISIKDPGLSVEAVVLISLFNSVSRFSASKFISLGVGYSPTLLFMLKSNTTQTDKSNKMAPL